MTRKVRTGKVYTFNPVLGDCILTQHHRATKGQRVRVVRLHGCPPPGTMGQTHIESEAGEFLGMVYCNSLEDE
jgi:hypothetical protein